MPDPTVWGWLAAGAAGGAFMWLLRWILAHLQADIDAHRRVSRRSIETLEEVADE